MGRYRIRVATGDSIFAGSLNSVQLGLVGARGETELELQLRPARGQVSGRRGARPPPLPGRDAGGWRGAGSGGQTAAGPCQALGRRRRPGQERMGVGGTARAGSDLLLPSRRPSSQPPTPPPPNDPSVNTG